MCVFLQGFACKGNVNAIDQSSCGVTTNAFGFAVVTILLPIIGYTFLYCKVRNKDAVYDNTFLQDWGFMIIGYVSSYDFLYHEFIYINFQLFIYRKNKQCSFGLV